MDVACSLYDLEPPVHLSLSLFSYLQIEIVTRLSQGACGHGADNPTCSDLSASPSSCSLGWRPGCHWPATCGLQPGLALLHRPGPTEVQGKVTEPLAAPAACTPLHVPQALLECQALSQFQCKPCLARASRQAVRWTLASPPCSYEETTLKRTSQLPHDHLERICSYP